MEEDLLFVDDVGILHTRGYVEAYARGGYPECIRVASEALHEGPLYTHTMFTLSDLIRYSGNISQAISYAERAFNYLVLSEGDIPGQVPLSLAFYKCGKLYKADGQLSRALSYLQDARKHCDLEKYPLLYKAIVDALLPSSIGAHETARHFEDISRRSPLLAEFGQLISTSNLLADAGKYSEALENARWAHTMSHGGAFAATTAPGIISRSKRLSAHFIASLLEDKGVADDAEQNEVLEMWELFFVLCFDSDLEHKALEELGMATTERQLMRDWATPGLLWVLQLANVELNEREQQIVDSRKIRHDGLMVETLDRSTL